MMDVDNCLAPFACFSSQHTEACSCTNEPAALLRSYQSLVWLALACRHKDRSADWTFVSVGALVVLTFVKAHTAY